MNENVIRLSGDKRVDALLEALEEVIYERGMNMSVALIIGTIEMLKLSVVEQQKAAQP